MSFSDFLAGNLLVDYTFRILTGLVCGLLLGVERKVRHHTVGIKTLILITISSTLLSILSHHMAYSGKVTGDPTRIAAGVVTGIGFLGAGTILKTGMNIRGLTTAAIIFTSSAIGLACGNGLYEPALLILFITIMTLTVIEKIEHKFFPVEKHKAIHLKFDSTDIKEDAIRKILTKNHVSINDTNMEVFVKKEQTVLLYLVKFPDSTDTAKVTEELSKLKNITSFTISDEH